MATASKSTAKRAHAPRRADDLPASASPAAAGPSGALLEGHVGAQYLLPLLSGGEARGLPGVVVTRVSFQRAGLNHPMDDVIVTGNDRQGRPATLELQAKRTIAFTASDKVFADVVALASRAAVKPEFKTTRYELAVAIARTSTKIEQHIQDVLKWARDYQDAEGFFGRLNQPGAAHQAMREFVAAFRGHMSVAGAAHDDPAVWQLLSRFQVLAFDFEQPGSLCAQLARERCVLLLAPQDAGRAGELWDSLQQIALDVDATGGDLDAAALRDRLTGKRGYRLAGDRRLYVARERLAEIAENTLASISSRVHGVAIDRTSLVAAAFSALEEARYLEIRGAGGVGKSGVLKDLARRVGVESRIFVVAPHRIPGGGWMAIAAQLGCEVSAREFLADLAGDGGGTLFVDGLDRFDDPGQRATVVDLIRAAAQVRGFRVVVTARPDFDADARAWLPTQALMDLGEASPLVIEELGDDEVAQLRDEGSALASLLRRGHPAEKLVRNLYRLDRLARGMASEAAAPLSEAQMATQWWTTGDSADVAGRLERCRVLRALAVHSLTSSSPMDTSTAPADAITALSESGSLCALSSVRAEPAHDVLRDWAIGCLLYEDPERIAALPLDAPAPVRLVRGAELAARLHAELGSGESAWRALLDRVSVPGAHGSWRRVVLLALARSERAEEALNRCLPALAADNAKALADLVRSAVTVDSQPAAPLWAALGADTSGLTDDFVMPRGPAWFNLIAWSLFIGDRLPQAAVPQLADLYNRWCCANAGHDEFSPLLVARLYAWLAEVEAKNHPSASDFNAWMDAKNASGLSMTTAQESDLRKAFLMWCRVRPTDAEAYLQGLASHPHWHDRFRELLRFVGTAPRAAPKAMVDLFMQALTERDSEEARPSRMQDVFSSWDTEYFPASPARVPFLDVLQADKEQGLRLVRGVVAHAVRQRSRGREPGDNGIEVPLPSGRRSFPWRQTYMWSRSQDSSIVASALMALEAWAHLRIEHGEPVSAVIDDVLGPEGSTAAYLLVAVDVMLSHWSKARECLWPFAASAELLARDRDRFSNDYLNSNDIYTVWVHPEPAGSVRLDDLRRRRSRRMPLDAVLGDFGVNGPANVRESMKQALQAEVARIGAPDGESRGMADPRFAAMCALNQLDLANYMSGGVGENGKTTVEYVSPPDEARLLAELQEKALRGSAETGIRGRLMQALTKPDSPVELLEEGVQWATRDAAASEVDPDKDEQEWIERTRAIVAALVMRDGSREQVATYGDWARAQLAKAVSRKPDDSGFAKQLPYNVAAIAAVGLLAAYRADPESAGLLSLLRLAVRRDTGMVSVLRAEVAAHRQLRPELIRSLLRLGVASAIYAVPQRGDDDFGSIEDYRARQQALETARKEAEQTRLQSAVGAELRWLAGECLEPGWPELPDPNRPKERRGITLGKPPSRRKRSSTQSSYGFALSAEEAAEWLSIASELWGGSHPDLLCELVRHCWPWTAGANGVGCGRDEEPGELAFEWNDAYFAAALAGAVSAGNAGIREYVLDPLAQLPEKRLLDAAEAVLHALDRLWLNGGGVMDSTAVSIREALVHRLVATRSWRRLVSERSSRIELHAAGAVAAMFMGQHEIGRGPRCYVPPPEVARADLLLPMLTQLTEQAAGSTFVAIAFLGLLEIEPHANRLSFVARAMAAWWRVQGADAEFWIDHGVGRRMCEWIEKAVLDVPVPPTVLDGTELAAILDVLVQTGSPVAGALEERLASRRKANSGGVS